ncbi:MAG: right-handed parallel beta-helix repeat-containing protein [Kiritimatiellae bacterium]|nr:right-handed parallel beta-helix repeat-containing protein [Kiritimatiellia bacterium]
MRWIQVVGLFLAVLSASGERVIYIAAEGAESGDGSKKLPFTTLEQARDSIRAGRRSGAIAAGESVKVLIGPGNYYLKQSFILTAEDSGSAGAPVTYQPVKRDSAHFYGGVALRPESFKPVVDGTVLQRLDPAARARVLVCDVSEYAPAGGFPLFGKSYKGVPADPLLYVNGKPMTIARWPNLESDTGSWASFTNVVDTGHPDPKASDPALQKARPGAFVFEESRPACWDIAQGVWLFGYWTHDWSDEVIRIESYDPASKVVALAAPHGYGIMSGTWGRKERRFYALNLLEELDAPGEWYLDRRQSLLYFYPEAEFESATVILATLTEPMVSCEGAKHLVFKELDFQYGHALGFRLKQAEDVHVKGCRVANFAAGGIALHGSGNSIQSCDIYQIGRAGISVDGGDRRTLTKANNLIENNHVHHYGLFQRTYASGIGVQGCGQIVRHNCIHDAPHVAVLYGGNEHLFEFNEVYRVVMETGDAGAFYTGRDWTTQGNILRHNYVHDLGGGDADHVNTMGFYFDDCDCGDVVEGNVFFRAGRAIMIGGGRDNPIINNLVVECPIALHIDARGMSWKNWNQPDGNWWLEGKAEKLNYKQPPWSERYPRLARIMEDSPQEPLYNPILNNVFVDCLKESCSFDGNVMKLLHKFEIDNNLIVFTVSTNQIPLKAGIHGFKTLNGSAEDPIDLGFKNMAAGDFNLRWRARLLKEAPGFKPIPFDKIGLYKDKYRRKLY